MKQLIMIGIAVVVVGGLAYFINQSMNSDPGELVGIAVSKVENGEQRMHIVVSMGMMRNDPPRPGTRMKNDEEWIEHKFFVREAATGTPVRLRKAGHSDLITDQKASNPEFFIEGKLKPKTKYTFEFKRFADDALPYRHEFTTKDDGIPFIREMLQLVTKP